MCPDELLGSISSLQVKMPKYFNKAPQQESYMTDNTPATVQEYNDPTPINEQAFDHLMTTVDGGKRFRWQAFLNIAEKERGTKLRAIIPLSFSKNRRNVDRRLAEAHWEKDVDFVVLPCQRKTGEEHLAIQFL